MHFIPLSVFRRCISLGQDQIDVPSNTVKISKELLKDPRLSEFRLEWVKFIGRRETIPPEEVRKKAQQLLQKYGALFITQKK